MAIAGGGHKSSMSSCRFTLGSMLLFALRRNPSWHSSPAKSLHSLAICVVQIHQQGGYGCSSYAAYSCCTEGLSLQGDEDDHVNHALATDNLIGNGADELRLQTLANDGQLDKALAMLSHLVAPPSDASYLSLLKACSRIKSLNQAKQVHDHIGQHRSQLTGLLG
eukprot:c4119_g1_i1 orf=2-493(-)